MPELHYAGVGSRVTPADVCRLMSRLSARLEQLGFILRSGGAIGADIAFEQGISDPRRMKIYRPYDEYGEEDLASMAEHIEKSAAEISARLRLPLGVARVVLGDLVDEGFVAQNTRSATGRPDLRLLERVLDGLQAL